MTGSNTVYGDALMHIDNTYYSIFMNAIEGIFQSTPDGQYLNVNPSLAKMYGYDSPSELMRSVNNIAAQLYVNPDRRQQFIDEMAEHGIVKDFISQIYRKNKTKIWITENVRIVRDERGNVLYYEGFVNDITLLKKANERNRTLQVRLQQAEKMETIGTMANGIAHDFSNILSPIIGYTDLLHEMVDPGEKIAQFIDRIAVSAKRARELVRQIHTFGQPESEVRDPVQVAKIIDEVLTLLKGNTPCSITFHCDIAPEVPFILGDSTQIHQILLNLCTNAIHAMEDTGGELMIRLQPRIVTVEFLEHKMLSIYAGEYIELSVKDTGTGIPDDAIKKIFDPYFTTRKKGKGTGLGLATVHSIIKNYNGEIIVKSKPGKGTTFTIYLPVYQAPENKKNKLPKEQNSTSPWHIMMVDDDDDVLHVQGQLIELMGYRVSRFNDGRVALQSFHQDPDQYDLVLTDMNMPHMTGLDLSKSLLKIKSSIPIIMCTGFQASVSEPETREVGIRKLLYKPLTRQTLSSNIHSVLQQKCSFSYS